MRSEDVLARFGIQLTELDPMPVEVPPSPDWAPCRPGALGDDRRAFAGWLREWGLLRGVEVGTAGGEFAEVLLDAGLTLTCVDPWVTYPGYTDYRSQRTLNHVGWRARRRLRPYGDRVAVVRKMSVEAAADFADGSLDFVFIDANHGLRWVVEDLCAWAPKVRPGGVVSGHDYAPCERERRQGHHVAEAVRAYADAYGVRPWFTVGWGGDYTRTWFWVAG